MASKLDKKTDNTARDNILKSQKDLDALESKYKEIAADVALSAASVAPPPFGTFADLASIGKSVMKGDWTGALIDTVGLVPVIGDAIKGLTKGSKLANTMGEVADAIKKAKTALSRETQALIQGRKDAAKAYWADIKAKGKKEYDEAIKSSSTQKCPAELEDLASKKGYQYGHTPKSKEDRGKWDGERGDGTWVPDKDSKFGKDLEEINQQHKMPNGRYEEGFP